MAPPKKKGFVCCLCKNKCMGWGDNNEYGNNPAPLKHKGECCDTCNDTKVIPARIHVIQGGIIKTH